jgi:hypothetical protein
MCEPRHSPCHNGEAAGGHSRDGIPLVARTLNRRRFLGLAGAARGIGAAGATGPRLAARVFERLAAAQAVSSSSPLRPPATRPLSARGGTPQARSSSAGPCSTVNWFTGRVDQVRAWSRALSDTDVFALV